MTGTVNQIEWARQLKAGAEFDRVANALQTAAALQPGMKLMNTQAAIAILKDKRVETIANNDAGYFIREWQELTEERMKPAPA